MCGGAAGRPISWFACVCGVGSGAPVTGTSPRRYHGRAPPRIALLLGQLLAVVCYIGAFAEGRESKVALLAARRPTGDCPTDASGDLVTPGSEGTLGTHPRHCKNAPRGSETKSVSCPNAKGFTYLGMFSFFFSRGCFGVPLQSQGNSMKNSPYVGGVHWSGGKKLLLFLTSESKSTFVSYRGAVWSARYDVTAGCCFYRVFNAWA